MNTQNRNIYKERLRNEHKEQLGLEVDSDYFETSKDQILKKVRAAKNVKTMFFTKKRMAWSLAASVAILISLTLVNPSWTNSISEVSASAMDTIENMNIEISTKNNIEIAQNDFLFNSLFIAQSEIDTYVDTYIYESLITD